MAHLKSLNPTQPTAARWGTAPYMGDETPCVLIVDDDPAVRETTTAAFELAGYATWPCESGEHALRCIEMRGLPHVAVVDLAMPGLDGIELSRRIRSLGDLPIVILTGNTSLRMTADLIAEFADDYITKPVELEVLVARVGRVLRRVREPITPASAVVTVDDRLEVDPATSRATVDGQLVQLTPTESKLLRILLRNVGRIVASTNLVRRLWPCEEVFEDALRVHVHRLRQKIEADPRRPRYIHTCRGTGYRFAVSPPAGSSGGTRAPDV